MISVVGFDPSLNNWGVAEGFYDPSAQSIQINRGYVIQATKDLVKPKGIGKNAFDLVRASHISGQLETLLKVTQPQAVFVELPLGSQSASALRSFSTCIGLMGWLRNFGYPIYLLNPTEIKLGFNLPKNASKMQMIEAAYDKHPDFGWPTQKGELIKSKAEHIADAIAAIHAGVQKQEFINLLALARGA